MPHLHHHKHFGHLYLTKSSQLQLYPAIYQRETRLPEEIHLSQVGFLESLLSRVFCRYHMKPVEMVRGLQIHRGRQKQQEAGRVLVEHAMAVTSSKVKLQ